MVISIDETGTFNFQQDAHLRHFFVAAFLLSNNGALKEKQAQFESWARGINENKKEKTGELKGNKLTNADLWGFVNNVILPAPQVKFSCISVIPQKLNSLLVCKHKNFEAKVIRQSIYRGKKFPKRGINFIENYSQWMNARTESQYTKMLCLRNCLADGLKQAFFYAVLSIQEMEFLDIQFKIDQDFIKNENIYWSEYLLTTLERLGKTNPFPMLDTMSAAHPIYQKYVVQNKGINLDLIFRDSLSFLDSKEHFEIQIVDIIAIILNRHFNQANEDIKQVFKLLESKSVIGYYHTELLLNDFDESAKFFEFTGCNLADAPM